MKVHNCMQRDADRGEKERKKERKKERMGKGRQKRTTPLIPKARPSTRVLPPGIAPG